MWVAPQVLIAWTSVAPLDHWSNIIQNYTSRSRDRSFLCKKQISLDSEQLLISSIFWFCFNGYIISFWSKGTVSILKISCDRTVQIYSVETWANLADSGNKGIRDAGSTADFRILFEILKFKNLEILKFWKIWNIWKILEHLENLKKF